MQSKNSSNESQGTGKKSFWKSEGLPVRTFLGLFAVEMGVTALLLVMFFVK